MGLATFLMTAPMIYGAFTGAASGQIWDPTTGELYVDPHETCIVEAEDLVKRSASMEGMTVEWEDRWRAWGSRCRESYPGVDKLLLNTRRSLKGPVSVPSLGQSKE